MKNVFHGNFLKKLLNSFFSLSLVWEWSFEIFLEKEKIIFTDELNY